MAIAASRQLRDTIELVSSLNLSTRENVRDAARHSTKRDFFKELCSRICRSDGTALHCERRPTNFILDGHSILPSTGDCCLFVSVDVSNFFHYPVHNFLSLTVGMHAEQL